VAKKKSSSKSRSKSRSKKTKKTTKRKRTPISKMSKRQLREAKRIHRSRKRYARKQDEARQAKVPKYYETWKRSPGRYDLPGVDTPRARRRVVDKYGREPTVNWSLERGGSRVVVRVSNAYPIKDRLRKAGYRWTGREWVKETTVSRAPAELSRLVRMGARVPRGLEHSVKVLRLYRAAARTGGQIIPIRDENRYITGFKIYPVEKKGATMDKIVEKLRKAGYRPRKGILGVEVKV